MVIYFGTPYLETHCTIAFATVVASISAVGIASIHLEKRSMIVTKYFMPDDVVDGVDQVVILTFVEIFFQNVGQYQIFVFDDG